MPTFEIIALLKPPHEKETSFIALRLQPATMGSRLPHTYLAGEGAGTVERGGVQQHALDAAHAAHPTACAGRKHTPELPLHARWRAPQCAAPWVHQAKQRPRQQHAEHGLGGLDDVRKADGHLECVCTGLWGRCVPRVFCGLRKLQTASGAHVPRGARRAGLPPCSVGAATRGGPAPTRAAHLREADAGGHVADGVEQRHRQQRDKEAPGGEGHSMAGARVWGREGGGGGGRWPPGAGVEARRASCARALDPTLLRGAHLSTLGAGCSLVTQRNTMNRPLAAAGAAQGGAGSGVGRGGRAPRRSLNPPRSNLEGPRVSGCAAGRLVLPRRAAPLCAPSCSVEMSQGHGNALSVLLFRMLNTMLKAYLTVEGRPQARSAGCASPCAHDRACTRDAGARRRAQGRMTVRAPCPTPARTTAGCTRAP